MDIQNARTNYLLGFVLDYETLLDGNDLNATLCLGNACKETGREPDDLVKEAMVVLVQRAYDIQVKI